MPKTNIQEIERKWQKYWEDKKIYKFDTKTKKKIYSLDTPPPTISGKLHMGHAFGDAQQDFIARFKRMNGFEVLNPFGTDNNGLPTLRLVEKEKNVDSKSMSREEFIELCLKTIEEEYIPEFLADSKRLGISADWDIFYSTIDERSRRVSQQSFIDLYKLGREYRIDAPALWCPTCRTTIAQVELVDKDIHSQFSDIVFKVDNKDLIISTTRPELLPAIVAIFYHPDDKRFKPLKGKKAKTPLFDIEVPILPDPKADPEKGTGVVMCCTFGDQTDMEWQREHKLPIKMAIAPDGTMTGLAGKYKGLKIKEAREQVIQDLKKAGALKSQKKITHPVNVCERCSTEIEFIEKKQWCIKYLDLKEKLLKWGREIKWHPDHMRNRYENWVKGLKWDWCISRQIAFGIPFPVWYCKSCDETILADEKQLPIDPIEDKPPIKKCPKCNSTEFIPEKDVMNTWATSSLTPTITKDLLKDTPAYKKITNQPMSIRRNGQDIITFWDFNTIVKSQLHENRNPWNELYINGWILGKDGHKMSKSRGNGVSPQDVIEDYGADALRYLSASVKAGDALPFPEKELIAGKKFVTKIINAANFVFMNIKPKKTQPTLHETDRLFLTQLNNLTKSATDAFESYELSKAKMLVDAFFWHTFADNYLELVKYRVYNGTATEKASASYTLYQALLAITKMMAPITPFITEEIYQTHFKKQEKETSIHTSSWPTPLKLKTSKKDQEAWNTLLEIIAKARQTKSEAKVSMKAEIYLTLPEETQTLLKPLLEDLKAVTSAEEIKEGALKVDLV
ncbi:valine--tRNA ligase [Candidatus Pacearchaeota archaeon]|nr:valine--tRNA ligase [Candidatus Pacearchaeota archaeon]